MTSDTMDIDKQETPNGVPDLDKKRKSKHKDPSSPSKKRKHRDSNLVAEEATTTTPMTTNEKKSKKPKEKKKKDKHGGASLSAAAEQAMSSNSDPNSPFSLTTATLYLPLSPISISPTHALASLLTEHLSPLLLTYYPPLKGIVLAYSNASISEKPPRKSSTSNQSQDLNPQPLTLATTANEYGVLYVYLTATFLVFRPQRGQTLEGFINVQSEGFLGAVIFNLFSVGIERKRLPTDWKWVPPGEEGENGNKSTKIGNKKTFFDNDDSDDSSTSPSSKFNPVKEHFNPTVSPDSDDADLLNEQNQSQDPTFNPEDQDPESSAVGYFQSVSGHRARGTVRFRVVDIDVIPGSERDRGFISIEGTMLSPEEEANVVNEERSGFLPPRTGAHHAQSSSMTGAIPGQTTSQQNHAPEASTSGSVSREEEQKDEASEKKGKDKEKEKKSKSKSKRKDKEEEK